MNQIEFGRYIRTIEDFFGRLTNENREKYFNLFKNTDELLFGKAMDILVETHTTRLFPLPSHIFAAIRNSRMDIRTQNQPEGCKSCDDTGFVSVVMFDEFYQDDHEYKKHCTDCNLGRKAKAGWKRYHSERARARKG